MKAPALDLMRNLGLEPDPWQVDVLETSEQRLLLNCCRQAGKSTVVALLGCASAPKPALQSGVDLQYVDRSQRPQDDRHRDVEDEPPGDLGVLALGLE